MNKSIIIHGPAACGKTHHGKVLASFFGLTEVVELDEMPAAKRTAGLKPTGVLYLSSQEPKVKSLAFEDAMALAGLTPNSPYAEDKWEEARRLAAGAGFELRLNIAGARSAALVPKESATTRAAHTTLVFPSGDEAAAWLKENA